jgi:hypothetical protein
MCLDELVKACQELTRGPIPKGIKMRSNHPGIALWRSNAANTIAWELISNDSQVTD